MVEMYLTTGYMVVIMLMGAMGAKSLAPSIVAAMGISMVYPNVEQATFIFLLYVPAYLLAAFRE